MAFGKPAIWYGLWELLYGKALMAMKMASWHVFDHKNVEVHESANKNVAQRTAPLYKS